MLNQQYLRVISCVVRNFGTTSLIWLKFGIPLLIKALAKGQTPPSSIVRSAKMGYQVIALLMPVVLIYFLI